MRKRLFLLGLGLLLAACGPEQDLKRNSGPVLISDVTLVATTPAPTRVLSPTPSPIVIPVSTSEVEAGLKIVTLESDFVLVTPTLPPSKTPSQTPTKTAIPSRTPPVTATFPPLPTLFSQSTSYLPPPVGYNSPPAAGVPQNCATSWFFASPVPVSCPLNPPLITGATFQQFQKGFMIWVQQSQAIYVLYDSANLPRWQVVPDTFTEGMPETDPAFGVPPPYTWQPRRGFGLVWRTYPDVRQRLGWAVIEWETTFTVQMQTGTDGLIYFSEPRGGIFALTPDGSDWKRYEG
ncbi:MAG TPA: hypothetical protein VHO69_05385 [Phototrophicaceae bacterium]|nr:hypothetical protein [Phototrophicaceae bacterium]